MRRDDDDEMTASEKCRLIYKTARRMRRDVSPSLTMFHQPVWGPCWSYVSLMWSAVIDLNLFDDVIRVDLNV